MLFTNVSGSSRPSLKIVLADPAVGHPPMHIRDLGEVMPFANGRAKMNIESNLFAEAESHQCAIQEQLQKLLRSSVLIQSDRLSRFLTFAVESALTGKADCVKEYTIGIEAYDRGSKFDPSQDSIVRTEARRLRTKLSKYYQEEGIDDPIVIEIHPGSYVPSFRLKGASMLRVIEHRAPQRLVRRAISVLPLTHLTGDSFGETCARGLTDEIMHGLTQAAGFDVFTSSLLRSDDLANGHSDRRMSCRLACEGIVRTEGDRIRVTFRLCGGGRPASCLLEIRR